MQKILLQFASLTIIFPSFTLAFAAFSQSVKFKHKCATRLPMSKEVDVGSSSKILLLSKLHKLTTDGPQRLILASQSPRRREILDMMGLTNRYSVTFSPLDEEALQLELRALKTPLSPQDYAKKLAESKAFALAEEITNGDDNSCTHESSFILGSDTIVDYDGAILEKPKSKDDAKQMLTTLSGSWHEVHTGVALYKITHSNNGNNDGNDNVELVSSFTETAKVKFAPLSSEDIAAYVETGEPMDKAGSYGIQGIGGQMVERMDGDFFAVMGLPMHRLSGELAKVL